MRLFLVNSGDSRQVYYVFKTPLKNRELLDWKQMTNTLQLCLGINSAVTLGEHLALPGTINTNYGSPFECLLSDGESSWISYSVGEIKQFQEKTLQNNRRAVSASASSSISGNDSGGNFLVYIPTKDDLRARKVPLKAIETVFSGKMMQQDGVEQKYADGQFNRDFWISKTLLERDFTQEEVKAVFRSNPTGCGARWANRKDGEKYLENIVSNAALEISSRADLENNLLFTIHSMPPSYELDDDGSVWLISLPKQEGSESNICFKFSYPPD